MFALSASTRTVACLIGFLATPTGAWSQSCPRASAGGTVVPPPDLYSQNGALNVAFTYVTATDAQHRTLYCFVTPEGLENPTLHVKPGDTLTVALTNSLHTGEAVPGMAMAMHMAMPKPDASQVCGDATVLPQSVNLHFHGMNVAPTCHSDEVIRTLINPGQTFHYTVKIPADEPPGMYWYHPHIHGISHNEVEGGASGAIEVEGIQNVVPQLANLPQRILIMRDQTVEPHAPKSGKTLPNLDLTLNTVPIAYPSEVPAEILAPPAREEFSRFVNASADDIAVLRLVYDGVTQTLGVVALDGVPVGSQAKTFQPHIVYTRTLLVPPAGRAEFIVTTPAAGTQKAVLETLKPDNGPSGDSDPGRTLASIDASQSAPALPALPAAQSTRVMQRFGGLDDAPVTATRKLYFWEMTPDPGDPADGVFYIVVNGQTPTPFNPDAPPSITTTQGAVEDWVIENRTQEVHEFHIHQIHFQLREINGKPVPAADRQMRDTVQIPYWSGKGPYPSVTVRMDFRGQVVGDFVYHCHILDHEDLGMMAVIRVKPKSGS